MVAVKSTMRQAYLKIERCSIHRTYARRQACGGVGLSHSGFIFVMNQS